MIKLEPYAKPFQKAYWKKAIGKVDKTTQSAIIKSCRKYLPSDFWDGSPSFRKLILAPFQKLKAAQAYINRSKRSEMIRECYARYTADEKILLPAYQTLYDAYKKVADSVESGVSMRVRLVRQTGLTVCPYCNRDYINCRADHVSGAQLDHFFSKDEYPIFAVCLYNLIPVCANCNRTKSNQSAEFASPFDPDIDWNRDITFTYAPIATDSYKIILKSTNPAVQNNIDKMRLPEAYQIHDKELKELLKKKRIYTRTQTQEFQKVLYKVKLKERDIKRAVFGPEITDESIKTTPLGKMTRDLHRQLGIYPQERY